MSRGLREPLNGVLEHYHAVTVLGLLAAAGPTGVLRGVDMSFRMRHQAKDTPAGVTDASHIRISPIGIMGERQNLILNITLISLGISNCQSTLLAK
jgi:hypothetical protein